MNLPSWSSILMEFKKDSLFTYGSIYEYQSKIDTNSRISYKGRASDKTWYLEKLNNQILIKSENESITPYLVSNESIIFLTEGIDKLDFLC